MRTRLLRKLAAATDNLKWQEAQKLVYMIGALLSALKSAISKKPKNKEEKILFQRLSTFKAPQGASTLSRGGKFFRTYNTKLVQYITTGDTIINDSEKYKCEEFIQMYIEAKKNIIDASALDWFRNVVCKPKTFTKNINFTEIDRLLVNTNYNPQIFKIDSDEFDDSDQVSSYSSGKDVLKIYMFNNGNGFLTGVLTRNNKVEYQEISRNKSASSSDVDAMYKAFEDKVKVLIDESNIPEYSKLDNVQFNNFQVNTNQNNYPWKDGTKIDTSTSINLSAFEIVLQFYYSNFDKVRELLRICIKHQEKTALQSFKLIQVQSNMSAYLSRLRKKVFGSFYRKATNLATIRDNFKNLFSNNGFTSNNNFKVVASYFTPAIKGTTAADIEREVAVNNSCKGILLATNDELIAIPESASISLQTFDSEYKRIYNNIKNMSSLKSAPQYGRQIITNILNSLGSHLNILEKVKNLFSTQEISDLQRYDQDIVAVTLNKRLDELFGTNSANTDRVFLALLVKKIPNLKIFKHGEIAQADNYLRLATSSQFTFLHDISYKSGVKYNATPNELASPTPDADKPKETIVAVVMKVVPGDAGKDPFIGNITKWVDDNKAIIINYTSGNIAQQLERLKKKGV